MRLTFYDRLGIEIIILILFLCSTLAGSIVIGIWGYEGELPTRMLVSEILKDLENVHWYWWLGPYSIHWALRGLVALSRIAYRRLRGVP